MHWIERLSEYHDGELASNEHAACEAHVAACESCRTVLEEIRMVASAARADADRLPVHDLWPGVLAQITPAPSRGHVTSFPTVAPTRRQITFSLPQLALAASLLIAVTAGVSYVATGRSTVVSPQRPASPEVPIQAMAEPLMAPSAGVVPANFADAQFDQAVADLEKVLVEQREALDPRTVVVIERNLRVIDEAIRQARSALDADPANTFLNSHLADARRRKLELLRRATALSASGD
jgi:negative regulator of sigma E activity